MALKPASDLQIRPPSPLLRVLIVCADGTRMCVLFVSHPTDGQNAEKLAPLAVLSGRRMAACLYLGYASLVCSMHRIRVGSELTVGTRRQRERFLGRPGSRPTQGTHEERNWSNQRDRPI